MVAIATIAAAVALLLALAQAAHTRRPDPTFMTVTTKTLRPLESVEPWAFPGGRYYTESGWYFPSGCWDCFIAVPTATSDWPALETGRSSAYVEDAVTPNLIAAGLLTTYAVPSSSSSIVPVVTPAPSSSSLLFDGAESARVVERGCDANCQSEHEATRIAGELSPSAAAATATATVATPASASVAPRDFIQDMCAVLPCPPISDPGYAPEPQGPIDWWFPGPEFPPSVHGKREASSTELSPSLVELQARDEQIIRPPIQVRPQHIHTTLNPAVAPKDPVDEPSWAFCGGEPCDGPWPNLPEPSRPSTTERPRITLHPGLYHPHATPTTTTTAAADSHATPSRPRHRHIWDELPYEDGFLFKDGVPFEDELPFESSGRATRHRHSELKASTFETATATTTESPGPWPTTTPRRRTPLTSYPWHPLMTIRDEMPSATSVPEVEDEDGDEDEAESEAAQLEERGFIPPPIAMPPLWHHSKPNTKTKREVVATATPTV